MSDTGPAMVVGGIIGLMIGAGAVALVDSHNYNYNETERRKQLVELGVGSYNTKTGGFELQACNTPK